MKHAYIISVKARIQPMMSIINDLNAPSENRMKHLNGSSITGDAFIQKSIYLTDFSQTT